MPLLSLRDVEVRFGTTAILRGVSLELDAGETLGVVGESGCGKSMTGLSIMGMVPRGGSVTAGSIQLGGRELLNLTQKEWTAVRGKEIAMVMQDPFSSLNPVMRIGDQIAEVLMLHRDLDRKQARLEAVNLLDRVGVPQPESSARKFPHQMSGGQRQRVVISIAFACQPKVLIADEPTTALDVTLQAQILRLIRDLQRAEGTAVILISHDIGVIASLASRIAVFYAGRVVEIGPTEQILRSPAHPYTKALLQAMPSVGRERLQVIPGQPPDLRLLSGECSFAPRCGDRFARCAKEPALTSLGAGRECACWAASESVASGAS